MPTPTGGNDSIITLGFDLLEETEQSLGEIVGGIAHEVDSIMLDASPQSEATPEQDATAREAREIAEAAYEREQSEREAELDRAPEYEHAGPEM